MRLPPDKVCRLIRKLYASTSSPFEHEAEVAKEKLRVLLFEHSLTEADISAILAATDDHGQKLSSASFPSAGAGPINVFDLNSALIDDHVTVTVRERTAISLWITHTYLFQRFRITPRLAILSPVEGSRKGYLREQFEKAWGPRGPRLKLRGSCASSHGLCPCFVPPTCVNARVRLRTSIDATSDNSRA